LRDRDNAILSIRGLEIRFTSEGRISRAVDGIELDIYPGETVGVVGETGCGKSVTALSVLRLIPSPPGRVSGKAILFEGDDLLRKGDSEMREIRGAGISMIFQEPMTSLDPSFTVGSQMVEILAAHRGVRGRPALQAARQMLDQVQMPHGERVLRQYPFELSGGMRQRIMIAMSLLCRPRLLIADEPTTALDVTVEAQILNLLGDLQQQMGMSILLITHDLGVVSEICDRVYVLYAGRVAETTAVGELFDGPLHPYTRGLIGAVPGAEGDQPRLAVIPGTVPSPTQHPPGCRFHPRCGHATGRCRQEVPTMLEAKPGHHVACYLYE
jgi:oligopeptide/dipeptide ABC transporter ATP-binding protein